MELLITDVTVMHGGNYCVAGWNAPEGKMIRPLPLGHHWSAALLAKHSVVPGSLIHVQPSGKPNSAFPHRTEDMPINPDMIRFVSAGFVDWTGPAAPPTFVHNHGWVLRECAVEQHVAKYPSGCLRFRTQTVRVTRGSHGGSFEGHATGRLRKAEGGGERRTGSV
jgi:hypothetical protein